jgi:hypothetical protein
MGKTFEMRTYQSGLKYFFGKQILNSRKIRWSKFLSENDFDIKHIIGKGNKVSDAISRRVHEMHATTINMYTLDLCDMILEVVESDQHYVYIKANLQKGISQHNLEGYEINEDEILMYSCRVYVPNDQELEILLFTKMHKVPYLGNLSYQKIIIAVKK